MQYSYWCPITTTTSEDIGREGKKERWGLRQIEGGNESTPLAGCQLCEHTLLNTAGEFNTQE